MPKVIAEYHAYGEFHLSKEITLLPPAENKEGKPWSWYIKWNTLYYLDAEGVEHEVESEYEVEESLCCKRPAEVTVDMDDHKESEEDE
jgi:hypothetical protein